MTAVPNPQTDADQLEADADQAIAACGGDAREVVKALIVANHFRETEIEKLRAAASTGYARGPPTRASAARSERLPRVAPVTRVGLGVAGPEARAFIVRQLAY
jgi:hypothetical protein